MKYSENEKINTFMDDLLSISPDKLEMLKSIRKMFLRANQNIKEDVKYGGVVFNLSDSLVGGIFIYKNHISIEFSNGANFSDPSGVLEGKGKKRRHLKIVEKIDINTKSVNMFILEAAKL